MSSTSATIDLLRQLRPVADSVATFQTEWEALANCADSVLSEVDSIVDEVAARAREVEKLHEQLVVREQELEVQRVDFARLTSRFDQQAGQLTETSEELVRLRETVTECAPPATLAADAARLAMEQAERNWQRNCSEILERLSALTLSQQTGAVDNEGVQAFCHELTLLHELINSSQERTRISLEAQAARFDEQLLLLSQSASKANPADEALSSLGQSLAELRDELTKLQVAASTPQSQDEVLKRLDALASAPPPVVLETPLLAEILEKIGDTSEALDRVQVRSFEQASAHEAIVTELRAELQQLRAVVEDAPKAVASPFGDDQIAKLLAELEAQRKLSEQAMEDAHRQETARALIEAELGRVRTQAALWQRKYEEDSAHHHEEEQLWHEELQDLRHLIRQAAMAMEGASHIDVTPSAAPTTAKTPDAPAPADPVANTLLAQFAKLQKDSARRRNRGP